ncbi:Satratoxin biosynthesis SC1 cluster protein 4, partial [Colletotrichum shisoi]
MSAESMAVADSLPILLQVQEDATTKITERYPPLTRDGASLVITAGIMMVLTTLWTIMRLVSRRMTGVPFHLEDYFYFVGQSASFSASVVIGGAGHDIGVLDPEVHVSHFVKIFLAAQRIFSLSSSWFRTTSWLAVGLSCAWALYTGLLGFVICRPVRSAWDISVAKTGCGDYTVAFSAVAVFDIVTDVVIVVLPIRVVSGLQMARAHKLALYVVFGAGFVTIIFSGVRLYYTLTADFVNITRGFASASVSGVLQSGIAVMVASSPMLRPVFDRTIVRWFRLSIRSGSNATGTAPTGSQGHIAKGSRSSQLGSHRLGDGFKQMSDSDENLSWEMQGLDSRAKVKTGRVLQGN